jgi:AcrR family transcriptional regulator
MTQTEARSATAEAGRGRRRTQQERREAGTSALIEATISSLCEAGYARTTTTEIVRRAGCTTGSLQHHFGAKEDLLLAVLDRLLEEFQSKYDAIENLEGPLDDRCRYILETLWEIYSSPRYMAVWEISIGTRGEPNLHRAVARHRADSLALCEQAWLGAFADFDLDGERLSDLMHFSLTILRGFVSYSWTDRKRAMKFYRRQIDLLKKVLLSELGRTGG